MTTTKTLILTFKNAKNKKVNLSLPDAAENLTENEIKDAMNEMCEANLFVSINVLVVVIFYSSKFSLFMCFS